MGSLVTFSGTVPGNDLFEARGVNTMGINSTPSRCKNATPVFVWLYLNVGFARISPAYLYCIAVPIGMKL